MANKLHYPENLEKKKFHRAKFPKKVFDSVLPIVLNLYSNYSLNNLSRYTNKLLRSSNDVRIKEVSSTSKTVLSLKQPPTILRKLYTAKFSSLLPTEENESGLFKCRDKRCLLCKYHIIECKHFLPQI